MDNKEFTKLSKKKKLELPYSNLDNLSNIELALFIPTKDKNECGYTMSAFFVKNKDQKWYRFRDYDVFSIRNAPEYLRGDFENHGIQFFMNSYDCIANLFGELQIIK